MTYFDSHAHYFDRRFLGEECKEGVDALLDALFAGGNICGIVNVGTNPENSLTAVEQAKKYPSMYAAVGIYPEDARYLSGSPEEQVARIAALLDRREAHKIVALGEIGLDYHYEGYDPLLQKRYFDFQLCLAEQYGIPVIIHDRDAHGDCFDTVMAHPRVSGVFHSCSMSAEMARDLARRGWYISFSGTVSFKNARKVAEAAAAVPPDRLLIETDCPYLAPHPLRGTLNHSGNLVYTNRALAAIRGLSEEETARITCENAKRLFGLR